MVKIYKVDTFYNNFVYVRLNNMYTKIFAYIKKKMIQINKN